MLLEETIDSELKLQYRPNTHSYECNYVQFKNSLKSRHAYMVPVLIASLHPMIGSVNTRGQYTYFLASFLIPHNFMQVRHCAWVVLYCHNMVS